MDNHQIELPPEPSDRKLLYSALGWIGAMLVFVLIVFVAYLPNRQVSVDGLVKERRLQILADIRANEAAAVSNYSRSMDGRVRIPVDRAMALIVPELNAKPVVASGQVESAAPAAADNAAAEETAPEEETEE